MSYTSLYELALGYGMGKVVMLDARYYIIVIIDIIICALIVSMI